jgi:hypothetical protein
MRRAVRIFLPLGGFGIRTKLLRFPAKVPTNAAVANECLGHGSHLPTEGCQPRPLLVTSFGAIFIE